MAEQALTEKIKRWTLVLGVAQITFGCLIGFIPPPAIQWYRGIVMAHIEFAANGVMMIAFGFLVTEMRLGRSALLAWFVLLNLGTWTNGGAGLAAALLGSSSKLMPSLNQLFPPPNGTDHAFVTGLLLVCGVTILAALFLTLFGLLRPKKSGARGATL